MIGRFIQADTIVPEPGNPQALNRYSYVLGNLILYSDPTGHRECRACPFELTTWGIDSEYAGPWDTGQQARNAAVVDKSLAMTVDFTPVAGDIKGLAEVFTGYDLVTHEDLGNWRWLGLVALSELRYADEVADVAAVLKERIVIGEGMDAVVAAAKLNDAKWYQAWKKFFDPEVFDLEASLARNERWIRTKIKEGYEILDIGLDPLRSSRSPFYELERRILEEFDYPTTRIPRPE